MYCDFDMLGLSKSNESELVKTESEAIVPVLEQPLFIIIAHIVKRTQARTRAVLHDWLMRFGKVNKT